MTGPLRATHTHTKATAYRRPGGPWDLPDLDTLLRAEAPKAALPVPHDLVVDGTVRYRAEALDHAIGRLAGGLRAAGVRRGDVVTWQLPNGHESVLLYRACWRLGAVAAAIHHQAGPADVERMLSRLAPTAVVAAAPLPLADHPAAVLVGGSALPARRTTPAGGTTSAGDPTPAGAGTQVRFESLLDAEPVTQGAAKPSDLAAVLFTAGSSGEPKGVLHTHRTLGYKARLMPEVHGLGPSDAVLMPAPLAHISGLLNGLLVPQMAGMTSVLMARWNTGLALDFIERERITFMVGPPTFFIGLMDDPGFSPRRVRSLRLISTGGAGVTPAFVARATAELGAHVKRAYGSTEAPTVATSSPEADLGRAGAADGHAIGAAELRVVNGELWVRGPELCAGYIDEAQTEATFERGGWFRTGDLAAIDGGWLTITGRLKDIIIRGGENISVHQVESLLEAHPDVRHAAVVGYPDDRLGERVAAFVVTRPGATFDLAECQRWCEARGAARFTWPERVRTVDELPVLPAGKVDKAALAARLR